jgi:hypothetical protein
MPATPASACNAPFPGDAAAYPRTRHDAGDTSGWVIDPARIEEILGLPRYTPTPAESAPEVGVVTGLAWTAAGGELMFIEALRMPGSGRLIITGMLGEVMRESVNAAYSYVRSRGEELRITEEDFRSSDIHVHFPVGAIPKDGPSAGIAVTLAIASTLSNRPVRHDIAMSGEVTLRGKVLEIGGVKEKVLAAHRAGIGNVILPRGNERDLRDVPDDVRGGIEFHFVERMDEVVRSSHSSMAPKSTAAVARGGRAHATAAPPAGKTAEMSRPMAMGWSTGCGISASPSLRAMTVAAVRSPVTFTAVRSMSRMRSTPRISAIPVCACCPSRRTAAPGSA